eukprot:3320222-Rhodomonas_salina.2
MTHLAHRSGLAWQRTCLPRQTGNTALGWWRRVGIRRPKAIPAVPLRSRVCFSANLAPLAVFPPNDLNVSKSS